MKPATAGAFIAFVAVFLMAMAILSVAFGHDHAHPELDSWYRSLESRKGPCCGPEDEYTALNQLDTFDWRTKDGAYQVFVEGRWLDVPPEAIVQGQNKAGRPLVWLYHFQGEPMVRCFMPGSMI